MNPHGQKPESAADIFLRVFGAPPKAVAHAPGRVNLIGEHTDYNDGLAMPMALEQTTATAFGARNDGMVHCLAADFGGEQARIDANAAIKQAKGWQKYVRGVVCELRKFAGCDLRGGNLVIKSALPIGAGLSSSAALELSVLRALCHLNGIPWRVIKMAKLAQTAENIHAGVNCGIMDQMCVACGKKQHALLLDCRTLRRRLVPLPQKWLVVVMDTATRRSLRSSTYNKRRAECMQAAKTLGVRALRDASMRLLADAAPAMDTAIYHRALHVIGENARVRAAQKAFADKDDAAAAELFAESHRSLRDNFAVGGDGLDVMVAAAVAHPACIGARQTGGGFAGCAVALVQAGGVEDFIAATARRYRRRTGLIPAFYRSRGGNGAYIEKLS